VPRDDQHRSLVEGLRACVPYLRDAGVTLLVEPLNTAVDHSGYYLSGSDEAFDVIDEVGDPHVKLLFDIYHQQITEGHLIARITRNIDKIGHFHAAGNPGRHELDSGEIHYPAVFRAIDASGYDGLIGLEYFPLGEPLDGVRRALEID
jgi:hydroxypyruvate isomerase